MSGGFQMPKKGEAASMLQELNAEHAAKIVPETIDESVQKSVHLDTQKDVSTSGQINLSTDKLFDTSTSKSVNPSIRKPTNKKADKSIKQSIEKPVEKQEGLSIRERIIAEKDKSSFKSQILLPYTIRMTPELIERIDAYCATHRKKKQDIARDAFLLYFETVED